jgi:hypothetical protein
MGMSSETREEVGERGVEERGEERAGRALDARLRAVGESEMAERGAALLALLAATVPVLYASFWVKNKI